MFDEKTNKKKSEKLNKKDEKILYSVEKIVCFACGEKIDKDTIICPYCKTTIR